MAADNKSDASKHHIIYSRQRSGTHFLASLMNSHPDVRSMGECFHVNATRNYFQHFQDYVGKYKFDTWEDLFRKAWESFEADFRDDYDGVTSTGPIMMYNQTPLMPAYLSSYIMKRSKILHLVRSNLLRRHISNMINKTTDRGAHHRSTPSTERIELATGNLIDTLSRDERALNSQRRQIKRYDVFEVEYEALAANREEVMTGVFGFMGLDYSPPKTSLKRSNPASLRKILKNYDAVAKKLSGTEYEIFLVESDE